MLRQVVTSQIIQSVGYDAEACTLEVQFRNGWLYQYDGVPAEIYRALMVADSHGRYLKRNIVDKFVTPESASSRELYEPSAGLVRHDLTASPHEQPVALLA